MCIFWEFYLFERKSISGRTAEGKGEADPAKQGARQEAQSPEPKITIRAKDSHSTD